MFQKDESCCGLAVAFRAISVSKLLADSPFLRTSMSKIRCVSFVRFTSRLFGGFILALLLVSASQGAEIAWSKNLQNAAREAARQDKPMLVMVSAQWCGFCHRMFGQTFANSALAARINARFVPVLIDFDEQSALVASLKVQSLPTVLVMAPDRRILARQSGFQSVAQLDAQLASVKTGDPKAASRPKTVVTVPAQSKPGTLTAAKPFSGSR